jgi:cytoskeletal protein CcmA (bactofilin family)
LEIAATAVIQADIVAHSIAIAKGAVIDGEVTVTSGQPVVEFQEKRGPEVTAARK